MTSLGRPFAFVAVSAPSLVNPPPSEPIQRLATMSGTCGNLFALHACLEDAATLAVDRRAFLGDSLGCRGHSEEIVAVIGGAFDIVVAGNHEQQAAARSESCGDRRATVDFVISLTGYAPAHALSSELALAIGPVTEGSARLERALANVTDGLSVPKLTDADLASGEPGFHLLGAKSYGRARTFLLQTGYGQVDAVLGLLAKKDSLLDGTASALQGRGFR